MSVRKPDGRRAFGRPKRRWEDDNRTYVRETGFEGVDWIHVVQDRVYWRALVDTVINVWVVS
jgi:hypothetical protein